MNVFGWAVGGGSRRSPRLRRALGMSIGLAYLVPVFVTVMRDPQPKLELGLLALAVYVAAYFGTAFSVTDWTSRLRTRSWVLLALFTALTVVLPFLLGQAWVGLPFYLAIVYACCLPMRWTVPGIAAASGLAALQTGLILSSPSAMGFLTLSVFTVSLMALGFRHSRMLVQQLQEARSEVAKLAATDERLRIARDLHDLLGHSLSLIVLKSEVAKRIAPHDFDKTMQEVKDIESVARQALADVREAVSGYRQRNLTEELDNARAVLAAAGMNPIVRTSGTPLPDVIDGLFGWAVREGVTNVVRHSRATQVEIGVSRTRKGALLEITDNGAGPAGPPGNGISGLTERIAAAGGTVQAGRGPDGGFQLSVTVPGTTVLRASSLSPP